MKLLAGQLLIAPPQECDPDFSKAVLLVIQHSAEQALGLVLNRPTGKPIKQVWKGRRDCECYQHIYSGGPIPGSLIAVHADKLLAEMTIGPGLYYSVRRKSLERLLQRPDHPFKIFEGHAGWGPGQLEYWLEADGWLLWPALHRHVFDVSLDLWTEVLELDQ
jgi:putative transcriptional regulator